MQETPPIPLGTLDSALPIIGVSGQSPLSYGTAAIVAQLKAQGAYPILLPHDASQVKKILERVDGVVVLGNPNDIDPCDYGQENKGSVVPDDADYRARMAFESALVEGALEQKIPLLGICGGMQRMNVGGSAEEKGTLIQDIPTHTPHLFADAPYTPVQFVKLLEGSRLKDIAKDKKGYFAPLHAQLPEGIILENSLHHQAVDKIRQGFNVAAISPDGVVEAIESQTPGQWAIGVQWHPEFGTSPVSQAIIADFTQAAKAYDRGHVHQHQLEALIPQTIISAIQKGPDYISRLFENEQARSA